MEHKCIKCSCGEPHCPFCEGGLCHCIVCGGIEGQLTTDCCGYRLDTHILDAVYNGGLDYINGKWLVAPKHIAENAVEMINWRHNMKKNTQKEMEEWARLKSVL